MILVKQRAKKRGLHNLPFSAPFFFFFFSFFFFGTYYYCLDTINLQATLIVALHRLIQLLCSDDLIYQGSS
ncbi:hypothetical protein SODALDRAFT_191752 [Sodiomyces alkalinus F11]|uniref:Uncharacterized protein n=1 Tax=Sodiomyces alkalinus (strain CBS 110278 / VKM F-3762 / F11) TaxID=1314773 RepID=A0A3N2PRU3_SODAK|nr:hypothetical protein SODALDRAFT_191752 [Sodiomyces alkalinus F11]ROT37215.1 hypothetical protein SODALDRAFT_191752 [Sodiomyces alkalinus F11]